jgi:hypothetical protein
MKITDAHSLGDPELIQRLPLLASGERISTVELIIHLAEFDARRLCEGLGFRSTFQYCRELLRFSEDAAANRIEAARAARRYPEIVDLLLSGELSPTTVRMLGPHLTDENHASRLAAARGKGKREVDELIAEWAPQPAVPDRIRPLRPFGAAAPPAPGAAAVTTASLFAGTRPETPQDLLTPEARGAESAATAPATRSTAPSLEYAIQFMAGPTLRDKLREAQDLLGHAAPRAGLADVVERGLDLLLADLRRKKFGETAHPRQTETAADAGVYIPAAVRRAVWKRDGGRCAFVASNGRRCDALRCLEYHHVLPRAAGGRATVENIQLRCRAHNGHEVERFFGRARRYRKGEGGRVDHTFQNDSSLDGHETYSFRNDLLLAESIRTPPRAGSG